MRQPVVGIHRDTNEIVPIAKVTRTGLKCNCICYNCESPLEAVLNTSRRQHFRHSNKSNCTPTPESELHLLAKTIILNNNRLYIPGLGMTNYVDPVCEVRCNDLVPDATIIIGGLPYHIEIVVTNPIDIIKLNKYHSNHSRVVVINLQEEDRDLDYEILESVIIEQHPNRYILSYPKANGDELQSEEQSFWKWGIGLGLGLAGFWIFNRIFKTEYPRKKY